MSGYYLILMFGSSAALWGVPERYPDAAQCEAAGRGYTEATRGRFHCLPAPITTGTNVNRTGKGDAFPVFKCWIPNEDGPPGKRMICE